MLFLCIALFLCRSYLKALTSIYYYPWKTCSINQLLSFLGSIHTYAYRVRGTMGNPSTIAISVARYSCTAE